MDNYREYQRDAVDYTMMLRKGNVGQYYALDADDSLYHVNDGVVYWISETEERSIEKVFQSGSRTDPSGAVVRYGEQFLFVGNADETVSLDPSQDLEARKFRQVNGFLRREDNKYISFSFTALARLLGNSTARSVAKGLASGALVVVDYSVDKTLQLTAADKIRYLAGKNDLNRPSPEFTLIDDDAHPYWHRPGSVVIRRNKRYFLLGRDEGTYYGVELPSAAKTVDQAYRALMPRELQRQKKPVFLRQGEWFAIPVKDIKVNPRDIRVFSVALPRDDADGAFHVVTEVGYADEPWPVEEAIVIRDGVVYGKGVRVRHSREDHKDLFLRGQTWYKFVRNTALQSVSEAGVD